ncbi:hypothetical protein [uncultured Microbacterium sp.]|uniref:hypothetical protein n=1 Tax=uncultured Microbacterium sp. TaxID=191216 RepID=UPI0035CA04CD
MFHTHIIIGETMSRKITKKQRIAAIVAASVLLIGGGAAAFAYWTSTGNGSGSATTGTDTPFEITSTAATGPVLTPGGPSQSVAFTVTNPGTGTQNLTAVTAVVANADGTPWEPTAGAVALNCSADDYTLVVGAVTSYGDIVANGTATGSVTVSMVNAAANQNDCKGLTVPIYFEAS